MNDERGYDWNRIGLLLMITKELALHPKLKNLMAAAAAELDEIANPPSDEEETAEEQTEEQTGDPGAPPDPNEVDEQPKETKNERRA